MRSNKPQRTAFTLVELMVAMAITMLLMAGLAKSFGVIGETIKAGRSQVTMSGKMRNLSYTVRSTLSGRTVDARPPISSSSGRGYFMYYEGPLTEHTFGLFGARPERVLEDGTTVYPGDAGFLTANAGPTYRRHGRVGDFDDYVAFTAAAPDDQWFTGKVPAYLVEDNLTGAAAMEPRVIRSKYAEIIIWASPEWDVDPATNTVALAPNPTAMPLYRDDNLDLVPDRIVLHQRTLLIRPDLNVNKQIDDSMLGGAAPFYSSVLRPWNYNPADAANVNAAHVPGPLERVYPIGFPNPDPAGTAPSSMLGSYVDSGSLTDNRLLFNSNWLVGMAPLHHFFDISLRRVIHPDTGEPTGYVAANSLEDLVQPHNRFAHVRYPGRYFNANTVAADDATSMPLLALGWNDSIVTWLGASDLRESPPVATPPSWFPTSHPSPRTLNTAATPSTTDDTRSGLFNGWLLPHFELGNPNPVTSNPVHPVDTPLLDNEWRRAYLSAADPRWDRTGEDVIAANILAFDLRGYDPTAPVFITAGADGQPGRAGVDDDGIGGSDITFAVPLGTIFEPATELGTVGSDDELVNVTDFGIYALMGQPIMNPNDDTTFLPAGTPVHLQAIADRGAFVDLIYPYLAGSPLLNRTAETGFVSTPPLTATTVTRVGTNYSAYMQSSLSQFPIFPTTMNSIKQSGKLVHTAAADGSIVFFQPTYDTWTDGYEHDGFDQSPSTSGAIAPATQIGTVWILNTTAALRTPRVPATPNALQIDTGQYDRSRPETSPPLAVDMQAISVTVRMIDPSTEEMSQFTVIEDLQ